MANHSEASYRAAAKPLDKHFPTIHLDSKSGGSHVAREHTTRHGDTFASLAHNELARGGRQPNKTNIDHYVKQMAELNGFDTRHVLNGAHLKPGSKLLMPGMPEQTQHAFGADNRHQWQPSAERHERSAEAGDRPSHAGSPHGHSRHKRGHGHGHPDHGGRAKQSQDSGTDQSSEPARRPGPRPSSETDGQPPNNDSTGTADGTRGKAAQPAGEGANMRVTGPPTISAAEIDAVLAKNHSPAAGLGKQIYDMGVKAGINPAVALAMFQQESSFGKAGAGARNMNPGNIKAGSHGFRHYGSWEEGFKGMFDLLSGHGYAGGGRQTVGSIISKWAPPSDGNNTSGYIRDVSNHVIAWARESDQPRV